MRDDLEYRLMVKLAKTKSLRESNKLAKELVNVRQCNAIMAAKNETWKCMSKGHIVTGQPPDVCPECKKEKPDLWLSRFVRMPVDTGSISH